VAGEGRHALVLSYHFMGWVPSLVALMRRTVRREVQPRAAGQQAGQQHAALVQQTALAQQPLPSQHLVLELPEQRMQVPPRALPQQQQWQVPRLA
jgi:hypothetical protein